MCVVRCMWTAKEFLSQTNDSGKWKLYFGFLPLNNVDLYYSGQINLRIPLIFFLLWGKPHETFNIPIINIRKSFFSFAIWWALLFGHFSVCRRKINENWLRNAKVFPLFFNFSHLPPNYSAKTIPTETKRNEPSNRWCFHIDSVAADRWWLFTDYMTTCHA